MQAAAVLYNKVYLFKPAHYAEFCHSPDLHVGVHGGSRPSERCDIGLSSIQPYAEINDLTHAAAFGIVSVLLLLCLPVVEMQSPEGSASQGSAWLC